VRAVVQANGFAWAHFAPHRLAKSLWRADEYNKLETDLTVKLRNDLNAVPDAIERAR
jgi:hypothetical protein